MKSNRTKTQESEWSPLEFYKLKTSVIFQSFIREGFSFWMACAYLFFEYVRPQSIWTGFDVYPYWARTFIMLAFLGWLIDPLRKFVWTPITSGVMLFLLLIVVSSQFAYFPEISSDYFMDFFNWVVVFFVLTQTVTNFKRFYIILLIFMVASFKLSFYGARNWIRLGFSFASWGIAGPEGYFHNPGELAIQMVVFAPIALFFVMGISGIIKKWQTIILLMMPFTAAMTVLGTNSRGAQIAMAAQVVGLIMTLKHRFKTLVFIFLIGFTAFQILPQEQKDRFSSMGDDETSEQRLLYWKYGWKMIKEHPFLGVGYYNFSPYYTRFHQEGLIRGVYHAQLPHNIFIQVGTDAGFSGLAVYLALMYMAFAKMYKIGREAEKESADFTEKITKGMNLSLAGYIVGGQFVTITYYPFFWIHLVFVVAIDTYWKTHKTRKC